MVIANMIGTGVFTSSGFSLGALGNPGRVMLAWWLCGIWALCGAVAYGALVSRLPMSGGEYLFLSRFVHPAIGFLAGWISVVAGFTAPLAIVAMLAASYAFPEASPAVHRWIAATVIALSTICFLAGLRLGTAIQNGIVVVKLVMLAGICLFAVALLGSWQGTALPNRDPHWMPASTGDWSVLLGSMSWVALSYTGFNAAVYVAGEAENATLMVPRAMWVGTLIVTALYLILNGVFVYAPAPQSIENQSQIASIVCRQLGGRSLELAIQTTVILACLSSVFSTLLAGPRVYRKMAEDGVMPKLFIDQDNRLWWATCAQAALSIAVIFLSDILSIMTYLGLTLSLCGALAVASLWWVRHRLPGSKPLTAWEHAATAVYLVITVGILWGSRTQHEIAFNAMLGTFTLGSLVYITALFIPRRPSTR